MQLNYFYYRHVMQVSFLIFVCWRPRLKLLKKMNHRVFLTLNALSNLLHTLRRECDFKINRNYILFYLETIVHISCFMNTFTIVFLVIFVESCFIKHTISIFMVWQCRRSNSMFQVCSAERLCLLSCSLSCLECPSFTAHSLGISNNFCCCHVKTLYLNTFF